MDPITLMIALMAAGTLAQSKGGRDRQRFQQQAMDQNAEFRDKNTKRATDLYDENIAEYDEDPQLAAQRLADERLSRTAGLDDRSQYDPLRGALTDAESGTERSIAKIINQELERGKGQIKAKALLEGYSDRSFEQGLRNYGRQGETSMLSAYDQGYQNILNSKMAASQFQGRGWEMLGDMLVSSGMIAGMGGFEGMGGAGKDVSRTKIKGVTPSGQKFNAGRIGDWFGG